MSEQVKVVWDESDAWNVEALVSGQIVVFACDSLEAANELKERIDACSWSQIENRQ
jgi:hypothetical protein